MVEFMQQIQATRDPLGYQKKSSSAAAIMGTAKAEATAQPNSVRFLTKSPRGDSPTARSVSAPPQKASRRSIGERTRWIA
jgi:hypothetical protein